MVRSSSCSPREPDSALNYFLLFDIVFSYVIALISPTNFSVDITG